jgi:hypothetical protein
MNTTLWLLIEIGSLHHNNVHMHEIPLCSRATARMVVCFQTDTRVTHFTHLQEFRKAFMSYISFILYSFSQWSNECKPMSPDPFPGNPSGEDHREPISSNEVEK